MALLVYNVNIMNIKYNSNDFEHISITVLEGSSSRKVKQISGTYNIANK